MLSDGPLSEPIASAMDAQIASRIGTPSPSAQASAMNMGCRSIAITGKMESECLIERLDL